MDQTIVTASLPLLGVAVGAGLQYWFGRALELRKQMVLQKVQAYSDYFKSVAIIAKQGRNSENISLLTDAKIRVCLYGSSTVIKHLSNLEHAGNDLASAEGMTAVTALLAEMRKDGRAASGLVSDDVLRVVLFGRGKT